MQRHAYTNLTNVALIELPPVMRFGLDWRGFPDSGKEACCAIVCADSRDAPGLSEIQDPNGGSVG
jgi:hypothetical protein